MTERRVPREIVIMPSSRECAPRFGNRTATEHDMADAYQARQDFILKNAAFLKDREEQAAKKATEKFKEEFQKQQAGKFTMILYIQFVATAEIVLLKWMHVL